VKTRLRSALIKLRATNNEHARAVAFVDGGLE